MQKEPEVKLSLAKKIIKASVVLFLYSTITSCSDKYIKLDNVSYRVLQDRVLIIGRVEPSILAYVKRNEIYLMANLVDCSKGGHPFSAEIYVNSKRLLDFEYDPAESGGVITSEVPKAVFEGIAEPCLAIYGSGYFTRRLVSHPVPLAVETH